MIFGKLIGALLGFFAGGLFGAMVGGFVGHLFDRGLSQSMRFDFGGERERLQKLFFETTFSIMGHVAKADGRVSEAEIASAEALMTRLQFNADQRTQAITCFKQGAAADFQLEPLIARFVREGGRSHNLPAILLEFLVTIALADGELADEEKAILMQTAGYIGINPRQFEQLLAMLLAQQQFHQGYQQYGSHSGAGSAGARTDSLANAYAALGVRDNDDDKTIKHAYRKLMSEHHPDKLIARGVPEEMLKVATEKAQEIQAAYDLIKRQRGM